MKNIKVIAVRYYESQIIEMRDDFESIADALGTVEERNYEALQVGMYGDWWVYLVEGSDWYLLENQERPGARLAFIEFLEREHGGSLGNYHAENFRAMDREDF